MVYPRVDLQICARPARRTTIMNMLLFVSIAWVILCVLFVGLELILLRIVDLASDKSQAMARAFRTRRVNWQSLISQWTRPLGGKRMSSKARLPNWRTGLP